MIFERFVTLDELRTNDPSIRQSLAGLLETYKAWVDQVYEKPTDHKTFLEIDDRCSRGTSDRKR